MKNFFIRVNSEQKGPFSLEELKSLHIANETYVWYEGLDSWRKASEIEELKDLISVSPPPFETAHEERSTFSEPSRPKKRGLTKWQWIGVILILGVIFRGIVSLVEEQQKSPESYAGRVKSILEIEQESPSKFLKASGRYNENFWGTKFKMNVTIENTATVAKYKDVVLEIKLYSTTNTLLKTVKHTFYEYVSAHGSKSFDLKVDKPENVEKIGIDVVSAIPV